MSDFGIFSFIMQGFHQKFTKVLKEAHSFVFSIKKVPNGCSKQLIAVSFQILNISPKSQFFRIFRSLNFLKNRI